jgi:hypothetical protein
MERLKHMKETLIGCIESQMCHLETVDTEELGDVIDMVKDLEEAIYYCTITKAMEGKEKNAEYYYPERDMDREHGKMYYNSMPVTYMDKGRMYYNGNGSNNSTPSSASHNGSDSSHSGMRNYSEMEYPMMRDKREGRSPMSRRTYMESKEMHQPKTTQMKELEKYLQELSSDIVEMIEDASPEEKTFLEKKIAALASKISQS